MPLEPGAPPARAGGIGGVGGVGGGVQKTSIRLPRTQTHTAGLCPQEITAPQKDYADLWKPLAGSIGQLEKTVKP
jgi:hypothetical protein